jgi:hypothetical protein
VTETVASLTSIISAIATSTVYTTIFVAANSAPALIKASSTSLSTGAKAGVGAGAAAGALLVIGALLYFSRRRGKRYKAPSQPVNELEAAGANQPKAELDYNSGEWGHRAQAFSRSQRVELQ